MKGRPYHAMLHGWVALICRVSSHRFACRPIGPVGCHRSLVLALGVPLVPWRPPVPCSLAPGLVPGPGLFVAAGASFMVWRRVCSAHAVL